MSVSVSVSAAAAAGAEDAEGVQFLVTVVLYCLSSVVSWSAACSPSLLPRRSICGVRVTSCHQRGLLRLIAAVRRSCSQQSLSRVLCSVHSGGGGDGPVAVLELLLSPLLAARLSSPPRLPDKQTSRRELLSLFKRLGAALQQARQQRAHEDDGGLQLRFSIAVNSRSSELQEPQAASDAAAGLVSASAADYRLLQLLESQSARVQRLGVVHGSAQQVSVRLLQPAPASPPPPPPRVQRQQAALAEGDWELGRGVAEADADAAAVAASEEQDALSVADAAAEQFSNDLDALDRDDRQRAAAQSLQQRVHFQQADVHELNTGMGVE